ncbi:MAG: protein kinase [Deltaproteobacteria bacterium]
MHPPRSSKIFISYARGGAVDRHVEALREGLQYELRLSLGDADLEVFQDVEGIRGGDNWKKTIRSALEDSSGLVVLVSPLWFHRPQCLFELELFQDLHGADAPVFPILWVRKGAEPASQRGLRAWTCVRDLQSFDWTRVRRTGPESDAVRAAVIELADAMAFRLRPRPPQRHESTLENLLEQRDVLRAAGDDASPVEDSIEALKRELRAGPELLVGDVLADRYILRERIGSGGFATVWRARDRQHRRDVAVKVLHGHLCGDARRVARFFAGAEAMKALNHAHVVEVYDPKGEDEGHRFFVMEFVEGGDLEHRVSSGPLTWAETERVLREVGAALVECHAKGLVHRDIKPANILFRGDERAVLADFDLVRDGDTTGVTFTGALGTVVFSAPECARRRHEVDDRSDVYSLAMTGVVALLGEVPEPSLAFDPARLVEGLPVTDTLRAAFEHALRVDREERPTTLVAWLAELEAAGGSEDVGFVDDVESRDVLDLEVPPPYAMDDPPKPVVASTSTVEEGEPRPAGGWTRGLAFAAIVGVGLLVAVAFLPNAGDAVGDVRDAGAPEPRAAGGRSVAAAPKDAGMEPPSIHDGGPSEAEEARRRKKEADALMNRGRYQAALEAYALAGEKAPDDASIRIAQGICKMRLGQPGSAEMSFDEALQIDPSSTKARAWLQRAQRAQKRD